MSEYLLAKVLHGSHLYGTNTESSDLDYKGVYRPSLDSLILQRVQGVVNKDVKGTDYEIYSVHFFLKLLLEGQTNAIDMIHASDEHIVAWTHEFEELRKRRSEFYTKNMRAFTGYCKNQASKYGLKGQRLKDAEQVLKTLKLLPPHERLENYWDDLPILTYAKLLDDQTPAKFYEVCGRKLMSTATIEYNLAIVEKIVSSYGSRSKDAKAEGVDYKALSHAFRVVYELIEIYETGDLKFPLDSAGFLTDIKTGKIDPIENGLPEKLDSLIEKADKLAEASNYPSRPNHQAWNDWILNLYK